VPVQWTPSSNAFSVTQRSIVASGGLLTGTGRIIVSTEPGRGSRFELSIRRAEVA
jgi:hypothetical protein